MKRLFFLILLSCFIYTTVSAENTGKKSIRKINSRKDVKKYRYIAHLKNLDVHARKKIRTIMKRADRKNAKSDKIVDNWRKIIKRCNRKNVIIRASLIKKLFRPAINKSKDKALALEKRAASVLEIEDKIQRQLLKTSPLLDKKKSFKSLKVKNFNVLINKIKRGHQINTDKIPNKTIKSFSQLKRYFYYLKKEKKNVVKKKKKYLKDVESVNQRRKDYIDIMSSVIRELHYLQASLKID